MFVGDERADAVLATPRAFATRAVCSSALRGLMCGSRPLAERVTASAGTRTSGPSPFSSPVSLYELLHAREGLVDVLGARIVGHAVQELVADRAEVRAARVRGVVTRSRQPKGADGSTARLVNVWPSSFDPTALSGVARLPSLSTSEPLAFHGKSA